MYGQDFVFNEKSLSSFGMIMCVFDDTEDDKLSLGRELISTELTSYRDYIHILGSKYTETLSFQVSIIKSICENKTQNEMAISRSELRSLTSWLTSTSTTSTFYLVDDDKKFDEYIEYDCLCTDIEPFAVGEAIYGLTATFTCNAPYGYSKNTIYEYECPENETSFNFTFFNDSDVLEKMFRPEIIRIYPNGIINAFIQNKTLNKRISLNATVSEYLTIDTKRKVFYENNNFFSPIPLAKLGFTTEKLINNINTYATDGVYWFDMQQGDNEFVVDGSIKKIEIECRFPRKVGGF